MKRKLVIKYKELENELYDIFESIDNMELFDESNARARIKYLISQLELLEEFIGDEHSEIREIKDQEGIIFDIRKDEINE